MEEDTKVQSRAFVIHNKFKATLYVDVDVLINLVEKHGYPSFTLDLVRSYIHELLHAAYPEKKEQEIFDLECAIVEEFLGFEMPAELKKQKATDYYYPQASKEG